MSNNSTSTGNGTAGSKTIPVPPIAHVSSPIAPKTPVSALVGGAGDDLFQITAATRAVTGGAVTTPSVRK